MSRDDRKNDAPGKPEGSSEPRGRIQTLLDRDELELRTGRMGRALQLGGLAVKGGGKWLVGRALALGADDEVAAERLRKTGVEAATDMLKVFAQMRGAAMKLGQMLSYIDDALPPEARKVLTALQRDAVPMPWPQVREQFRASMNVDPEELYLEFSPRPIAAASIGQVHRARLRDGTPVAVKIQYPGIEEAMRADLKNSKVLHLMQNLLGFRTDTVAIARELEERLLDECDYLKEAEYQEEFRARFEGHPVIVVPEVYREFSSRRVLTTRFYEGQGFYDWLATEPSQETRDLIARTMYRFYLGSFYLDGLFNCDPHPGNYIFLEDGRMVFLDYGCIRRFPSERRQLWIGLNRAVFEDDAAELRRLAVDVGFFQAGWDYDWEAFRALMRYLYVPYLIDAPYNFRDHRPETTFRQMFVDNPNLRKMNMPADAVFLNRIGFGLVSIMAEVGATLNVYRYASAYFSGIDPDWLDGEERNMDER